ncbi:hypothetical protein [Pseudomonas huanghezhanensis]|uniref:hypothetical protein n=1 Tax=Pseudomonas huanghezhanensis TaxID=3002903 RepID=UPI0022866FAE|nr:hypothetical protein [Pseudomonas sp. BSw22131]
MSALAREGVGSSRASLSSDQSFAGKRAPATALQRLNCAIATQFVALLKAAEKAGLAL